MRAFIFSLDAFAAFSLALLAIYSLIFFSSVPSSYYYTLTQGHYLTRDVLVSLSSTDCTTDYDCRILGGSLLDNIVQSEGDQRTWLIRNTVGEMIPDQFGYTFETSEDRGENWNEAYNTRTSTDDSHEGDGDRLTVSSQMITFGYMEEDRRDLESVYHYNTCGGSWLLTCDEAYVSSDVEFVPEVETVLVRITVFI